MPFGMDDASTARHHRALIKKGYSYQDIEKNPRGNICASGKAFEGVARQTKQ